jgi:hypothetical protein
MQVAGKEGLILLNAATTASAPFSDDKSVKYCKDDLCLNSSKRRKKSALMTNSFNYYNGITWTFFKSLSITVLKK